MWNQRPSAITFLRPPLLPLACTTQLLPFPSCKNHQPGLKNKKKTEFFLCWLLWSDLWVDVQCCRCFLHSEERLLQTALSNKENFSFWKYFVNIIRFTRASGDTLTCYHLKHLGSVFEIVVSLTLKANILPNNSETLQHLFRNSNDNSVVGFHSLSNLVLLISHHFWANYSEILRLWSI